MVHIGCGADVIRQRRRADAKKKELILLGLTTDPKTWKPARNKKYPHYTPARNSEVFNRCSYHRLQAVHEEEKKKAAEKVRQERRLLRRRRQQQQEVRRAEEALRQIASSDPQDLSKAGQSGGTTGKRTQLQRTTSDQTPFQRWIRRPLSSLSSSLLYTTDANF